MRVQHASTRPANVAEQGRLGTGSVLRSLVKTLQREHQVGSLITIRRILPDVLYALDGRTTERPDRGRTTTRLTDGQKTTTATTGRTRQDGRTRGRATTTRRTTQRTDGWKENDDGDWTDTTIKSIYAKFRIRH